METTEQIIEQWRAEAAEEAYFSASRVQSRLFDLYGVVDGEPEPARHLVEFWLTLTIQRDLFSGKELLEMLDELQACLPDRVIG
ncbi:MAG: hypothetical protein M3Q48_15590 [Actinomycetota bacterium]|nr:hypothetical protein [Actinomycetota bacterium]